MRCVQVTYLTVSGNEDGGVDVIAECDGGTAGDCGWFVPYDLPVGIDDAEWSRLRREHREHSLSECTKQQHP